jgi:hypothetical protein
MDGTTTWEISVPILDGLILLHFGFNHEKFTPPPLRETTQNWNLTCRFSWCVGVETVTLGTDHLTWRGGGGYGFLFRSEFFFRTTLELEYLFFLSRKARNFLPEFNIRLYDLRSKIHVIYVFPIIRTYLLMLEHMCWRISNLILKQEDLLSMFLKKKNIECVTM